MPSLQKRIRFQQACGAAAVFVFLASLMMPGAEWNGESVIGIMCAFSSRTHLPSNALLLLSPLIGWRMRSSWGPVASGVVKLLAVASFGVVAATPWIKPFSVFALSESPPVLTIGFYAWLLAHLFATLALLTPVRQPDVADTRSEDQRLQDELNRMRERWSNPAVTSDASL